MINQLEATSASICEQNVAHIGHFDPIYIYYKCFCIQIIGQFNTGLYKVSIGQFGSLDRLCYSMEWVGERDWAG